MTSAPANRKSRVLADLDGLRDLPRGWDGYGAAPIDRGIIKAAEHFITQGSDDFVTTTQVVPMSRGRLQFEWHRGSRSLELESESPDVVHYLKCDSAEGIEDEEIILTSEHAKLADLFRWFTSM